MVVAPKAVLFDVDGTVLRAGGAGRTALIRGTAELLGLPRERVHAVVMAIDFRGSTDSRIFREMFQSLGVEREPFDPTFVAAYLRALDQSLDEATVAIMPGVRDLLSVLSRRSQTRVGLLTGNVRGGARRKLDRIGLAHLVDEPGGFAEDGHERHEIAAAAMRGLAAHGVSPWATLVIGDTPADVRAAHHAGAPAVAVGTGWTPREELSQSDAQLILEDLSDPAPVLDLLDSL